MKEYFRKLGGRLRRSLHGPIARHGAASTPALSPPGDQGVDQALRPVSVGGPLPNNNSLLQPQVLAPPDSPRVSPEGHEPNSVVSTPPEPPLAVPVPCVVVSSPDGQSAPQSCTSSPNLRVVAGGPEPNAEAPTSSRPPSMAEAPQLVVPAKENVSDVAASTSAPKSAPDNVIQGSLSPTIQALPTAQGNEPSLWKQAFDKLSESDKKAFPFTGTDKREYIEDILEATKKSRDTCQGKGLKFKFRGKNIIVRDVADKLLTWCEKFKNIGDIAVQYDPVHAALPWAGVRFLLQIAVNNKETMDVVLVGVEKIARLLVRCAIYEGLYLRSWLGLSIRKILEGALEELYSVILQFLAFAKQYLDKPSAKKIFHGLLDVEGRPHFDSIGDRESQLLKEVAAAEVEARSLDHKKLGDQNEKLKVILEEMEKPITRIDSNVALLCDEFRDHNQNEKRSKILQWLSQMEYEKHHQNAKEGLLENTGQWLLDKEQFREWRSSSASGILWLHGIPGAGKTKLICRSIGVLESTGEPVVYFYCNRNESKRRDPTILMQAIVKQLSIVPSSLPKSVVAEYDKRDARGLAAGSLGFQESCDLVLSLLDIYSQTTIVIDALDESDSEGRGRLLDALKAIIDSSKSLVKVFVSSRDDIDITLQLEHVPNLYIKAQDNSEDIRRFVRREVTEAIDKRRLLYGNVTDELREEIIATIEEKANGMFQWADLQIKHLCKMRLLRGVKEGLGRLPKTLEETYSQILDDMQSGTSSEWDLTKKALMWAMYSLRPLNREEWAEASYWPESVPEGGVVTLFDLCHNLVTWDQQLKRVKFAHLSVQEYLESKEFSSVDANCMAAESCLSLLVDPCHLSGVKKEVVSQLNNSFVEYSIRYWAEHVDCSYDRNMGTNGRNLSERIVDLLQRFLGTSAKPGQAYCKWQQAAEEHGHRGGYWDALYHLVSTPPNPLFTMSYFHVGEELWECDNIGINSRNDHGETLLQVASMRGVEWAIDFLLGKGADVNAGSSNTNPLLEAVKGEQGRVVVKLVDAGASIGANNSRYTNIFEAVATEGDKVVMKILLDRDTNIVITEAVVVAAAGNWKSGKEIMEVLLARDTNIVITEAAIVKIAERFSERIMEVLLARDTNIVITEAVVVAAARNRESGEKIMKVLLARDTNIVITEAVGGGGELEEWQGDSGVATRRRCKL